MLFFIEWEEAKSYQDDLIIVIKKSLNRFTISLAFPEFIKKTKKSNCFDNIVNPILHLNGEIVVGNLQRVHFVPIKMKNGKLYIFSLFFDTKLNPGNRLSFFQSIPGVSNSNSPEGHFEGENVLWAADWEKNGSAGRSYYQKQQKFHDLQSNFDK